MYNGIFIHVAGFNTYTFAIKGKTKDGRSHATGQRQTNLAKNSVPLEGNPRVKDTTLANHSNVSHTFSDVKDFFKGFNIIRLAYTME